MGGINGIIYFATTLLLASGLGQKGAALVSGCLFTWFFAASFILWVLIDFVGRRKLLLVTVSCMALCLAVEAGMISQVERTGSKAAGAAAVAFLFVFVGLFTVSSPSNLQESFPDGLSALQIGFQAVVWVYPTELSPLRLRSKISCLSTAANWIFK